MALAWHRGAMTGGASPLSAECVRGSGVSYRGGHQRAAGGAPCLNWLDVQRGSGANHSSCRNPDGAAAPWCYVRGRAGPLPLRRDCPCAKPCPTAVTPVNSSSEVAQEMDQVFESADTLPSRSEAAAVQPVIGISQRVRMKSKEKEDLGTLGKVLGIIMMVIIISIGAGIVVGFFWKRRRDLKAQQEQEAQEREMQRIMLPLSAFTNPVCELVDEKTIEVHTNQTPVEETQDGNAPLMGQAGTPGA
uniref:Phosphoinositide-3-kinase interacting protein 1 n=1 Tax=Crocodylus porosus TaxID=8502 RepID=A0A7M4E9Y5_CROPO